MVAAGIGGNTIAEAKGRLSLKELRIWNAYRSRGMLMTARAHDINTATIAQSMRGGKLSDMLRVKPVEVELAPVTPEQARMLLGGKIGKRKG